MRLLRMVTLIGSASLLLAGASVGASGSNPVPAHQTLAGAWTYNPNDSLNAGSGRKEDQTTQRQAGKTGVATGHGGGRPAGTGTGTGGTMPGLGTPSGNNAFPPFGSGAQSPWQSLILNESRDLARDLLEVPTALQIKVSEDTITFVDHLARQFTYPTTGKKKKYQVSASVFEAKAYWDGAQLKKEIEGAEGFRMRETYFVSQDGQRLFVIVRVGDPRDKEAPLIGVDRVYDRGTRSK